MKIPAIAVTDIAEIIGAKLIGNTDLIATGLNEIHKVTEGDITFVDVEKYYKKSLNSDATIIIINKETEVPEGKALLICDDPFTAYNNLALRYRPQYRITKPIADSAIIGENCFFEPNVMIGEEVEIGKNCYIHANVVIIIMSKSVTMSKFMQERLSVALLFITKVVPMVLKNGIRADK